MSPGFSKQEMRAFSKQETRVLMFIARGLAYKQIAYEMGITEGTVKVYVFRIRMKAEALGSHLPLAVLGERVMGCIAS